MNAIRLAVSTSVVLVVTLLSVTAASGKPPGPAMNVACSQQALVDAINAANTAGGGTLNLAHGCDYQLTSSPDDSENGLPNVTTPITVNGNQATIDGTESFRVFEVDGPDGNLSLRDLTITGGSADIGGGIASFGGTVMLDRTQVTGNAAGLGGGGIASATFDPSSPATLRVRNSSVSNNQQTAPSSEEDDEGGLGGGGILNAEGTATIDHSRVNGNDAEGFVGGGIASGDYLGSGAETVLTVNHSQVNGNTAPNAGGGGGIQNLLGLATINHSQVNGNTAPNGGGIASGNQGGPGTAELRLNHSQVNGNTATISPGEEGPPFAAGGIANGSIAVIDHSQVNNNTSPNAIGAGIVNHATMTVSHSEVNGNTASANGAFGSAGGILNVEGPPGATPPAVLTIDHSKVNDNSAPHGYGGGIANGVPLGGPISPPGGDLTLKHSEVTGNTAAHGGGIYNNGGTVTLSKTKVTNNQVDNCEPTGTIAGCTN